MVKHFSNQVSAVSPAESLTTRQTKNLFSHSSFAILEKGTDSNCWLVPQRHQGSVESYVSVIDWGNVRRVDSFQWPELRDPIKEREIAVLGLGELTDIGLCLVDVQRMWDIFDQAIDKWIQARSAVTVIGVHVKHEVE
ncbi:hypothetical protein WICPIJ_002381 [Wickerhamomyces pijperi]|uniref:Uncharacterized protein n=1 Tax=Wickerhamomyces pijperi TaxID=599730 RepID=A0A9P8TQ80_WICPI|nr:hypothetical protein WICPIJ_002381 [Wickerhamomyces pijperi]